MKVLDKLVNMTTSVSAQILAIDEGINEDDKVETEN